MTTNTNTLTLIEKYTPKTLDELKLPSRIANLIEENINRKGYRFLFYGPPGTGKTSTSKLLNSDKNNFDVLYLSGSNDFNVQTLREKVYPFASNHSVLGKQKTIIIDESENIADKIQDAFKIILDTAKSVNFIFITNEVEKMNSAIMSRCTQVEYNYQSHELKEQQNNYILFLKNVVDTENIAYNNSGIKELYIKNFPDFRYSLICMQQMIDSKQEINAENVKNVSEIGVQNIELYELIEKEFDAQKFYEKATSYKGKERESLNSLAEPYFRYLNQNNKFEQTLKSAVIVAKYSNMMSLTTTKFGTFFAMLVELRTLHR
jgi:DNA polymerase III delta prime subunit